MYNPSLTAARLMRNGAGEDASVLRHVWKTRQCQGYGRGLWSCVTTPPGRVFSLVDDQGVAVRTVRGSVDFRSAGKLTQELLAVSLTRPVVVDLSAVEATDSRALEEFVLDARRAGARCTSSAHLAERSTRPSNQRRTLAPFRDTPVERPRSRPSGRTPSRARRAAVPLRPCARRCAGRGTRATTAAVRSPHRSSG